MMKLYYCFYLLLIQYSNHIYGGAISTGTGPEIDVDGNFCLRLFHSQGDIGCRSSNKEVDGPFYFIGETMDIEKYIEKGEKSVVIVPNSLLTKENLEKLKNQIYGLLVYPEKGTVAFSPASKYPQGYGSVDSKLNPFSNLKKEWNPEGLDILEKSFPFPVLLLDSYDQAQSLIQKASKGQSKGTFGPTSKIHMSYYYGPSEMDSVKCLEFKDITDTRNPRCDPVGGQSVWASFGDLGSYNVIMAITSMDSNGLSQSLSPGANAGASGVVALLAAADALKNIPTKDFRKAIIFGAFQSEKFGFVGSRKFLQDVTLGLNQCKNEVKTNANTPFGNHFCLNPLKISLDYTKLSLGKIEHVIAIDQVGASSKEGNLFIHENPNMVVKGFLSSMIKNLSNNEFEIVDEKSLPPSPLLSFLNGNEYGNSALSSAIITGYGSEYNNRNYHSRYDTLKYVDETAIIKSANVLAKTLYNLSTNGQGINYDKISINTTLVKRMITCFTSDWQCDLMKEYSTSTVQSLIEYMGLVSSSWPHGNASSLYSGVFSEDRQPTLDTPNAIYSQYNDEWKEDFKLQLFPNAYEIFVKSFLSSVTGINIRNDRKQCNKTQDCNMHMEECVYPGTCMKRTSYFHNALSPGLKETKTPGIFDVIDKNMPLWTEPRYSGLGTYLYNDPDNTIRWMSLLFAFLVLGCSGIVTVLFLRMFKKYKLL